MVAGGALYVRHPRRHRAVAVRATAGGAYRPGAASTTGVLTRAGYDSISPVQTAVLPPTAAPRAALADRRSASPAAPPSTVALPLTPAPAAAGTPATQDVPAAAATPANPLTPLLQKIVPTAAAVLGVASWFDAPAGTCAHRDLPLGTIVTVTRTSTGASTTCRVSDRGPSLATNRVIDLSQDTFAKLASPDAGVIEVRIEW